MLESVLFYVCRPLQTFGPHGIAFTFRDIIGNLMGLTEHFRLTRTSSDLRALAILTPPSPVLTASGSSRIDAFGEIPLVLDLDLDVFCDASIWCKPLPPRDNVDAECETGAITISNSVRTVDTVGTFGPLGRTPRCNDVFNTWSSAPRSSVLNYCTENRSFDNDSEVFFTPPSSPLVCVPSTNSLSPHLLSCQRNVSSDEASYSFTSPLCHPRQRQVLTTISRQPCNLDFQVPNSLPASNSLRSISPAASVKESEETPPIKLSSSYSTLPTPDISQPSPSLSVDFNNSTSAPNQKRSRPLARSGAIHQRMNTNRISSPDTRLTRSPRLRRDLVDTSHSSQVERHGSPTSSHGRSGSVLSSRSASSSTLASPTSSQTSGTGSSCSKFSFLPQGLLWLQHAQIELWIDQEGFRAIRPKFQLVGHSPRGRSLEPYETSNVDDADQTAGVAEFMPLKRESFVFHHSTLDGPPALRRITVNMDESRDYISRDASLSIKLNGVYTVRGSESSNLSPLDPDCARSSHVKLQWKFDYLVSDRLTDRNGKIMSGEKMITPLTFSCSPFLFHSSRGKKVGLIHVVKKSIVPKLAAEKLQPPRFPAVRIQPKPRIPLHPGYHTVNPRTAYRIMHRRSRSDAHGNTANVVVLQSLLDRDNGTGIADHSATQRSHRRRATSVGEGSFVASGLRSRETPLDRLQDSNALGSLQIMSRSQLSEMITLHQGHTTSPGLGLTSLAPPNYHVTRRGIK